MTNTLPKSYRRKIWGEVKYCCAEARCLMPFEDVHLFCQPCRHTNPAYGPDCNGDGTFCPSCIHWDKKRWIDLEAWYSKWRNPSGSHLPPPGQVSGNAGELGTRAAIISLTPGIDSNGNVVETQSDALPQGTAADNASIPSSGVITVANPSGTATPPLSANLGSLSGSTPTFDVTDASHGTPASTHSSCPVLETGGAPSTNPPPPHDASSSCHDEPSFDSSEDHASTGECSVDYLCSALRESRPEGMSALCDLIAAVTRQPAISRRLSPYREVRLVLQKYCPGSSSGKKPEPSLFTDRKLTEQPKEPDLPVLLQSRYVTSAFNLVNSKISHGKASSLGKVSKMLALKPSTLDAQAHFDGLAPLPPIDDPSAASLGYTVPKAPSELVGALCGSISSSICHLNSCSWFIDALLAAVSPTGSPAPERDSPQFELRILAEFASQSLQRALEHSAIACGNMGMEQRDRHMAGWHTHLPSHLLAQARHAELVKGVLFKGMHDSVPSATKAAEASFQASLVKPATAKRRAPKPPPPRARAAPPGNSNPPPPKRRKKSKGTGGKGSAPRGRQPKRKP